MNVREYNISVKDYSDNLYRYALKSTRSVETAEDIVQDIYEKLWIKRKNVEFAKVKSYLFTSAYHSIVDNSRKNKHNVEIDDANQFLVASNNDYSDLNEILHRAINRLPSDQKTSILLRDYEGYSYKEISEIMNITEGAVKTHIFRGRVFLKGVIGKVDTLV